MKTTIIKVLVILIFAAQHLNAQNRPADRIALKDGEVIEGIVIEQKPGEHIRLLRWPEKDTVLISLDQIDRMNRIIYDDEVGDLKKEQQPADPKPKQGFEIYRPYNSNWVYGMIHYVQGGGDYSFQGFGISFGLNITPDFQVGISSHYIGQLNSTGSMPDRQTIPLAIDLRQTLTKSKDGRFSTVFAISGGYNFTLNGNYFDESFQSHVKIGNGYYLNPAVGFKANIFKNAGLMIDIGYHYNDSNFQYRDSGEQISKLQWHNFLLRGSLFF